MNFRAITSNLYVQIAATAIGVAPLLVSEYFDDVPSGFILAMFVGFFLFFFGMASLVARWMRTIEPPRDEQDALAWDTKRAGGRSQYIRRFVTRGMLVVTPALLWLSYIHFDKNGVHVQAVGFLLFIAVMVFFALIGSARALWDYNEREFERFQSLKTIKTS